MFKTIFSFLPILICTVIGKSMEPTFLHGEKVVAVRFVQLKEKDVAVLKDPRNGRLLLKRITRVGSGTFFVEGDNKKESTDSNDFGWVDKKQLIGKVIFPHR